MFVITVSLDFLEIKEMESQYYQLIFQLKYTCNVSQQFFFRMKLFFSFPCFVVRYQFPKNLLEHSTLYKTRYVASL